MSKSINLRLVIAVAIAAIGGSCSSGGTPPADADASASGELAEVAGTVNGESITVGELDDWIRADLFEQQSGSQSKLFELRSAALERMIEERIIEMTAAERKVDPEELLEREVAALGEVTDEDVAAFYEKNQTRLARRGDLETLAPQIREFLVSERPNEVRATLREGADVSISLAPPRITVAAVGPSRGEADTPITIIEFSDYQCPFCSRAEPILEEVLQRYPGKVRLVYRHLPLNFHNNARPAAAASICAEEQEKFWEYHAMLFTNQRKLGGEDLQKYAVDLGLDVDAFTTCLTAEATNARIDADLAEARAAGASGTPAFFINGIPLSGALPVDAFSKVIDAELTRLGANDASAS